MCFHASRPSTAAPQSPYEGARPGPPPGRVEELARRAALRLPLHGPDVPAGTDPPRLPGDPSAAHAARLGARRRGPPRRR